MTDLTTSLRRIVAGQIRPSWAALASAVRLDWLVVTGLVILGLITRLPFAERILYHWDAVNFALGLHHFDVHAGQPHVPGYILYVYLGRLVNLIFGDAPTALVAISIASSSLALAMLYLLGKAMYNRTVGLLAALFLAFSPLFWFYGEIALPHVLDTLVVLLAVWLFYKILQGETRWLLPAAVWLGLAGGFRPQTEVFLAPLALYVGLRVGWRRSLMALVVLVLVNLGWFVPLVVSTGSVEYYFFVMGEFSADFNTTTSVLTGGSFGLLRNLRKLGMYTGYAWAGAILPFLLAIPEIVRRGWRRRSPTRRRFFFLPSKNELLDAARRWEREVVLFLWVMPVLAYYIFIHMGQQGLVFVFLPALMLLSAAGAVALGWLRHRLGLALLAALIASNALVFLFAPAYPLGGEGLKLLTLDTLRRHDRTMGDRLQTVRQRFPLDSTALISAEWRFPDYYLPEYALIPYELGGRWEADEGNPVIDLEEVQTLRDLPTGVPVVDTWISPSELGLQLDSAGGYTLVLFDEALLAYVRPAGRVEVLTLPEGDRLGILRFGPHEQVHLEPDSFEVTASRVNHP